MNFSDYQKASKKTAIYPNQGSNIVYPTLGLCGEAGEVAEKVKKVILMMKPARPSPKSWETYSGIWPNWPRSWGYLSATSPGRISKSSGTAKTGTRSRVMEMKGEPSDQNRSNQGRHAGPGLTP